jgi:hypothetical protein
VGLLFGPDQSYTVTWYALPEHVAREPARRVDIQQSRIASQRLIDGFDGRTKRAAKPRAL